MSEAYFRVESGALGPEENFLSLDDILMSHEKLPVRTETPIPRLGAFFLERSAGAERDHELPQVRAAGDPPEPRANRRCGSVPPSACASGSRRVGLRALQQRGGTGAAGCLACLRPSGTT